MMPHQEDIPTHSKFSFSTNSSSSRRNNDRYLSNELEFNKWAEKINKTNYNRFGSSTDSKVGPWSSHSSPRRYYYNTTCGEEEEEEESEVASPTLWQPAVKSPVCSRAQAIAKYRQEMLELVKDAPENGYELSLKDIVELPRVSRQLQQQGLQSPNSGASTPIHEEVCDDDDSKDKKKKKKNGKKRAKKFSRGESLDSGLFLLKMFVPPGMGRRQSFSNNGGGMLSAKPVIADGAERDWWKRNELSESSGSSSRGSRTSSTRRKVSGCLPFLSSHKSNSTDL